MIGSNLFVGVGGSGVGTLSFLINELKQRLIEAGWPWDERAAKGQPMPACWQFVAIDVDSNEPPDSIPQVPSGLIERISLAASPDTMATMYSSISNMGVSQETFGWLPPLTQMRPFNPYDGAGQLRAIGRAVALARSDKTFKAIDSAARRATSTEAQADLALLTTQCGLQTSTDARNRRVFLVSSLAGGSGSGIWLDVAQWLNARPSTKAGAWQAHRQYAFIYTPEVFENLKSADSGLGPNSLLSLTELLSLYADRAPYDRTAENWRVRSGIDNNAMQDKGPRSVFFIGSTNPEGISFGRVEDVYSVTSQMLAAFVAGDGHSSSLDSVAVNVNTVNEIPLLRSSHVLTSNIGYARLDLGRATFAAFAQRALFRRTVDRLLDGHLERRLDSYEKAEDLIERLAENEETTFFYKAGLYEDDLDTHVNDQIVEGILPPAELDALLATFVSRYEVKLRDVVDKVARGERKSKARLELSNVVDDLRLDVHKMMLANVVSYGQVVRCKLLAAVVDVSTEYSVPVAAALLRRLDSQLDRALTELRDQHSGADGRFDRFIASMVEQLRDRTETVKYGRKAARAQVQGLRDAAAAAFIAEVRMNLVMPLLRAVEDWIVRAVEQRNSDSLRATLRDWDPTTTPTDLMPTSTVVMIDDPLAFPEKLQRLLGEVHADRDGPQEPDKALNETVAEIVRQRWPQSATDDHLRSTLEDTGQLMIRELAPFSLSKLQQRIDDLEERLQAASEAPRPGARSPKSGESGTDARALYASLFVDYVRGAVLSPKSRYELVDHLAISDTCRHWVKSRPGALSTFVEEGFGSWLSTGHNDHESRHKTFTVKLMMAVSRAAPLAQSSDDALGAVHGKNGVQESLFVSPAIPVARTSALATRVNQEISSTQLSASVSFAAGGVDTSRLDIFRSFKDGIHPLALASLTAPIRTSYGNHRETFWMLRRARPLHRALSLTPAQILAFLRGWLVLAAFNRVDVNKGRVWLDGLWMDIPDDRLDPGSAEKKLTQVKSFSPYGEVLHDAWCFVALESLPMRLVRYPSDNKSLEFYESVVKVGGYTVDNADTQEEIVNSLGIESESVRTMPFRSPPIDDWMSATIRPARGVPTPHPADVGKRGDAADVVAKLRGYFGGLATHYEDLEDLLSREPPRMGERLGVEAQMVVHFLVAAQQLDAHLDHDMAVDESGDGGRFQPYRPSRGATTKVDAGDVELDDMEGGLASEGFTV